IDGEIEGWVHRGLRSKPKGRVKTMFSGKNTNFRQKKASTRNQRKADGGELKDLEKQLLKNLVEVGEEKINNDFIKKQLATISKPIAK
ncbi:hypothetical protein QCD71_24840, partial [Sphingomonas sp. PsM26]|nr:hypothetical protein [Sphingomonas sp. PsM26]